MSLVLPESVTVALKNPSGAALPIKNILIRIQTFARHKNDIALFPYSSDSGGVIHITKEEMRAEVEATYETGLMDYVSIESAFQIIEIYPSTPEEIEKAYISRSKIWRSLLKGEKSRWNDLSQLLALYQSAQNRLIDFKKSPLTMYRIRDEWNGTNQHCHYDLHLCLKT